ncbi:MAG: DUF1592 domain-containing protein [Planctomycetia bacterium]|nr:DUF1592 domain-containing protein [Planctomycetia bacterium]
MSLRRLFGWMVLSLVAAVTGAAETKAAELPVAFLKTHCYECHTGPKAEGALDLTTLSGDLNKRETFARWVKIHDRVAAGEMPPKDSKQPPAGERTNAVTVVQRELVAAEKARFAIEGRTPVRRMTRIEYENTVRDLLALDGIPLQASLPEDGSAHGFDKNSDALDISHVNLSKYVEAADQALDMAIAVQPTPPLRQTHRFSIARHMYHIIMNGDTVMIKDGDKPDPFFTPSGVHAHLGAHEHINVLRDCEKRNSSPGVFRHEDESFKPYFYDFAALYPGKYRIQTSFWSFHWDKGKVLPGRGVEAARLSIVQLQDDGRGGGHPSYILGYYDAPPNKPKVHEVTHWLNFKDTIGFNTASLAPVVNYNRPGRAMAFTGPGIACDYIEIEGPIHDVWPPEGHRRLFGDLPIVAFDVRDQPEIIPPKRKLPRRETQAPNPPDPPSGNWTVASMWPTRDADRLLASFLPRAFRRPVPEEVRKEYLALFEKRLAAGDCFETALRYAYRAALTSPDFLYHAEQPELFDDYAMASRLSYFLWNSLPDDTLIQLADRGQMRSPNALKVEVERMLNDPKSERFIEDFLGQWLNLRKIAANDPDRKLYPEFSPYLQDSMIAETKAYFRELLDKDLNASYLVRSDFAMLNEKLANLYGVPGVSGSQIRRVALPADCPRGSFLTQAAILKVTANGTTTSPVPRGAFVMARLLGQPPEPPPPNITAVEPDVQGTTTIREQLDKHRASPACAGCHAKMDPPGFALESFDVIGGLRDRYRSIGEGETAKRGNIDPFIGISFKLGPKVDSSGILTDGRTFKGITDFQTLLASDQQKLLKNLAEQLCVYATGRPIGFGDRTEIAAIVDKTQKQGGGVRTLIHELVASKLFFSSGPMKGPPAPVVALKPTLTRSAPLGSTVRTGPTIVPVVPPVAPVKPSATPVVPVLREPVRCRLVGLSSSERLDDLRVALEAAPELQMKDLHADLQEITLAYDFARLYPGSSATHKPTAPQLLEQINNVIRRASNGSFSVSPLLTEPRDKLKRQEIAVTISDCKACRIFVYNTAAKVEGVQQAAVDQKTGNLTVWTDPTKSDLAPIREALTKAQIILPTTK